MANNRFIFPVGGTPESVRAQLGAVGPAPEPGTVPAPAVGEVLTWDGTQWVPGPGGGGGGGVTSVGGTAPIASSGGATPTISISAATALAAGSMSAADKSKLDGIAAGASIAGTIAANEIAFGNGADSIGGSAQLEWNPGTGVLTVADAVVTPVLTVDTANAIVDLDVDELRLAGSPGASGEVLTSQGVGTAPIWSALPTLSITSEVFVTKGGSDVTGDGSLSKPYATVSAALASITTATPSARWAIRVAPGEYTEAGPIALKANVFIIGSGRRSTRLTSTGGWTLGASFTPAGDHRSGMTDVSLSGACTFNFSTVSSNEGKLYFDTCIFVSSVTITGFSSINQGEILDSNFFGSLTLSGVGWNNTGCVHFGQIFMNQHPTRATLLTATNGYADKITLTTTVNDFARRCSLFSRSFWTDDLDVDGDSSYADLSVDSVPRYGPNVLNNGNLINISPILLSTDIAGSLNPDTNNNRYFGDFGKQWLFNFNYLNVSTGTDLYVGTVDSSYDPAGSAAGYGVFLQPDQYGIRTDVNGGVLDMRTANATGTGTSGNVDVATGTSVNGNSGTVSITTGVPTGTGTRGEIALTARRIDASSTPLLHKWESGATGTRPAPLAAGDVGRTFFDTTLGLPIWWNGTGWINAAGAPV